MIQVSKSSRGDEPQTYLSVFDGEEDESHGILLQERLFRLWAVDIADEALSVLLNLTLRCRDHEGFDGSFSSGCFQHGEEGSVDGFGSSDVEVDGSECCSSCFGRGFYDGHGGGIVVDSIWMGCEGLRSVKEV